MSNLSIMSRLKPDLSNENIDQYMTIEDQQDRLLKLILAMQDSDEQAFSEFYDTLVSKVYALAYRIMANTADAEEVVCDVFTQIWQQSKSYHLQRGSVIAWTMVITRSRALDFIRKRKTINDKMAEAEEFMAKIADPGKEPDKIIEMFQENSRTHQLMASLPPLQRHILALSFFRGFSHKEISAATRIPLGTVKTHIRKALEQLQNKLLPGQYYETYE